jgi:hypothetical protein
MVFYSFLLLVAPIDFFHHGTSLSQALTLTSFKSEYPDGQQGYEINKERWLYHG